MRARTFGLFALALLELGCTRAQAAASLPRVAVRGFISERARARESISTTGGERLIWRVHVHATFTLDRPVRRAPWLPEEPTPGPLVGAPIPCVSPSLCTWERESRERALRRAASRFGESRAAP